MRRLLSFAVLTTFILASFAAIIVTTAVKNAAVDDQAALIAALPAFLSSNLYSSLRFCFSQPLHYTSSDSESSTT